jgi:FixJ family two-component response regulator
VTAAGGIVYVVDDDEAMRDSLCFLLRTAGHASIGHASAEAFLESPRGNGNSCMLLDMRLPGAGGQALQATLAACGERMPVIFVTGHGDVPMAVEALKRGAFDFLEKPFEAPQLLARVAQALESDLARREREARDAACQARLASLTVREQEVLARVLQGKTSRVIAADLHVTLKTVEFHRARILARLGVRSAAELFHLFGELGFPPVSQREAGC